VLCVIALWLVVTIRRDEMVDDMVDAAGVGDGDHDPG